MVLGVLTFLIHVFGWNYYSSRRKFNLLATIALLALSAIIGRRFGLALVADSALSIASVLFFYKVHTLCVAKKVEDKAVDILSFVVSFMIILIIGWIILSQVINREMSFEDDVVNTYIKNLYGTSRFSVIPFADICIMHFVYLHFIIFFILRRRITVNKLLFISISITALVYVIMIGVLYVYKWAADNIDISGEYLTGFGDYMITIAVLIYGFWIYTFVSSVFRNRINK